MQITIEEVERHHPDVLLPPDPDFAADYAERVREGREIASRLSVAFVFLARNSMPWLPRTLRLIDETGACFRSWSAFAMENDSADETKEVLKAWRDNQQRFISLNDYARPHLSHTMTQERTIALAEYRNACRQWVQNGEPVDLVCVLDSDSWGGWSIDGLMTSVAYVASGEWWGMASFSWAEVKQGNTIIPIHYDAWACRWTWWGQRDHQWFHMWMPPCGSRPVEMNSAFGQLAIYKADHYLRGTYTGETCEHVGLNRSIAEHPETRGRFGLNPSSRCVSFWHLNACDPAAGGLH